MFNLIKPIFNTICFGVYGIVNMYLLPLFIIACLTYWLLWLPALSKIIKLSLYLLNIFSSKNSTNLSLVDNIKNLWFLIYPDFIFFYKKYKISYHLLYIMLRLHI